MFSKAAPVRCAMQPAGHQSALILRLQQENLSGFICHCSRTRSFPEMPLLFRRVVLWPVMAAELQFRPFTLPHLATFTMFFDKSTNNFHKDLDFSYFNTTQTDRQVFLSCGLILLFNFTNLLFSTASLAVWPSLMRGLSFLMLSAQFPANILRRRYQRSCTPESCAGSCWSNSPLRRFPLP